MRASLPRPARSSPRPPSIVLRAFAQSVSRRALSAYCVPGPCWLLGLPWEPTRAHAELREERRSPLNPRRGAARHTRGCGPARPGPAGPALREAHGALGRRPLPTSRLQVVEIRIQASFQHLHDFLHRAMLNVIHAFFQIGLKRKKKKKSSFTRRAFTSHGKVCYTRCSGGPSLGGATANPGLPKRWLSASGTPGRAQSSACGTCGQPLLDD